MAVGIKPYGQLASGRLGFLIDDVTGVSKAAVIEVVDTIASVPASSSDNFPGRTVFSKEDSLVYTFTNDPSATWNPLRGVPASVGVASEFVAGVGYLPPSSPEPEDGSLFFATTDGDSNPVEIVYVWDGSDWQPVGGRYASIRRSQIHTGDGVTTAFTMGTASTVSATYVDVYIDGVRQYPNPSGAFSVAGTNVVFNEAPGNGTSILIQALENTGEGLGANAQIISVTYTAPTAEGSYTNFDAGVAGADPEAILVMVDREFYAKDVDYTVQQQNQEITTLTRSGTTATATITSTEGLTVGYTLEIAGVENDTDWNGTVTVTAVPSPTTFEFEVDASLTTPATGTLMAFSPPFQNDVIVLTTPLVGGENVHIRTIQGIVVVPTEGEANTIASLGSGVAVTSGKVGTELQFKSLVAGPNFTITEGSTELTLSVTSVSSYVNRVGINTNSYTVSGEESYIGVMNTSFVGGVTVSLSGIPTGSSYAGRTITVTDESGNANVNNITITTGGPTISSPSVTSTAITTAYGSVTMVFNGSNWFITSRVS